MNKKTAIALASIGALALGSFSFAAIGGKNLGFAKDDTVRSAVESGDYSALSDTAKTKISETQFQDMVAKQSQQKVIENALESGDYATFKQAMIDQIPTEAEFQEMRTQKQNMEAKLSEIEAANSVTRAAVEEAVRNNDFTAYKAAIEAQKASLEANRPEGVEAPEAPEQDESRLQEQFNQAVEYYAENGSLPERGGMR